MKKIFIILLVLTLLLVQTVSANLFATIGMQGLNMVDPQAAQAVQTVLCVSGGVVSCAEGMIISQVKSEALGALSEVSPEAAKAVQAYNQVKGYMDQGAEIISELELNDEGQVTNGEISFNEKEERFGNLIGEEIEQDKIFGKNINVKIEEGQNGIKTTTITFDEKGYININNNLFSNIKEGSSLKLDEEGQIISADIVSGEDGGVFNFNGNAVAVSQDTKVTYEEGAIKVYGEGKSFNFYKDKDGEIEDRGIIHIVEGESVTIESGEGGFDKISGKRFTIEDQEFISDGILDGGVTIYTMEGENYYILDKNTLLINGLTGVNDVNEYSYPNSQGSIKVDTNYLVETKVNNEAMHRGMPTKTEMKHNKDMQLAHSLKRGDMHSLHEGMMQGEFVTYEGGNSRMGGKYIIMDGHGRVSFGIENSETISRLNPEGENSFIKGSDGTQETTIKSTFEFYTTSMSAEKMNSNIPGSSHAIAMQAEMDRMREMGMAGEDMSVLGFMTNTGIEFKNTVVREDGTTSTLSANVWTNPKSWIDPPEMEMPMPIKHMNVVERGMRIQGGGGMEGKMPVEMGSMTMEMSPNVYLEFGGERILVEDGEEIARGSVALLTSTNQNKEINNAVLGVNFQCGFDNPEEIVTSTIKFIKSFCE